MTDQRPVKPIDVLIDWAFGPQLAGAFLAGNLDDLPPGMSMTAVIERFCQMGGWIDGGPGPFATHPDADALVRGCGNDPDLFAYARGGWPVLTTPAVWLEPVLTRSAEDGTRRARDDDGRWNERAVVVGWARDGEVVEDHRAKGADPRQRPGAVCPVRLRDNALEVASRRARWASVWAALDDLRFRVRLETVVAGPPSRPFRPWIGERQPGDSTRAHVGRAA